ncbi:DUF1289 domain-containing protein [Saccharospirillum sp. MSK14-1]|uniref:DUF1289 domain-containing protein n=1 Tax=Saccharospirillum sp. MSK14-1 TaxID=1897632 RepID=UPI002101780B|nr:DUF1289 domain-containing protein [Saccharospirillum sp. MSK14-1]
MTQLEFFDIPSPCIGVCESGPRGFCRGCLRSRTERQQWHQLDTATKRQVIRACQIRKLRLARGAPLNDEDAPDQSLQVSLFESDDAEET